MRDLLVTGTDTGVGKTVIAAALVTALRARGVRAIGFKPVETGTRRAGVEPDSDVLARASGERNVLARPLLQLPEAAGAGSGRRACRGSARSRRHRSADPAAAARRLHAGRRGRRRVMVPLTLGTTPCSILHRRAISTPSSWRAPGLGTLNHVAMTVMMLRSRRDTDSRHCPERSKCNTGPGRVDKSRRSEPDAPRRSHR